ncbi:MAG: tRNA dihydrouridine synthase DusB [Candidatus Eisenbacteria bacterium]|nr:tRNA dihydrouridine synthase DusB [Candidatus Eisenbacteria bacterium]
MRIGPLELPSRVLLAPLCGITDSAFRRLCRREGAGATYSEMVVSDGVIRENETTRRLMRFTPGERPYGIQLAGSDPGTVAEAARRAAALGPDLVDINLGCPVRKVVDRHAGSALLADLARLESVVKAAVCATSLPVTAKMRLGWDEKTATPVETARLLEGCGVQALALHARTRAQGFKGRADWSVIRAVKAAVSIPVIGNGDVLAPEDARRMFDETGCDAVMVGRGALGNPWIFSRTLSLLDTGAAPPVPAIAGRVRTLLLHLEYMIEDKGEGVAIREIRKHIPGYLKGERDAHAVRNELHQARSAAEMEAVLERYLEHLAGLGAEGEAHPEPFAPRDPAHAAGPAAPAAEAAP